MIQDLKYSGTTFKLPQISLPDTGTFLRDLGILAPIVAMTPLGWAGAIAFGLFTWLFGDSREEAIGKAKAALREALNESRDEIISNIAAGVRKVIDEKNTRRTNRRLP